MSASRVAPPVCEFDRAYRELVVAGGSSRPTTPCSPEPPAVREYPAPPSGGPSYVLCNGHLSDLFDARDRAAHAALLARPPQTRTA